MADDRFKNSLAGLSRALGERVASHPDPVGEAMERRAAVLAQFEKQEHQKRWLLGGAAAALGSAGVTILILFLVWPPGSPSPILPSIGAPATRAAAVMAAEPPPPPPIAVAAAPAPPPAETAEPIVVESSVPPALAPPAPEPAASAPSAPAPLGRGEVREVQTLLLRFGFDPGPVDGAAGRLTEAAVSKYQEQRALPQTGKPDRALLDQLREDPAPKVDPAPQVAQRPSWKEPAYSEPAYREPAYREPAYREPAYREPARREPAYVAPAPARQGSGFLGFLRNADNNLSRWLYSLDH